MASNQVWEEEKRDSIIPASSTPFIKRTAFFSEVLAYVVHAREIPMSILNYD